MYAIMAVIPTYSSSSSEEASSSSESSSANEASSSFFYRGNYRKQSIMLEKSRSSIKKLLQGCHVFAHSTVASM
jgi:hypothetical protein